MARTATTAAVKRILTKGLTGWEAGKLILQDMIDSHVGRDSVLTEADTAAIQQAPMEGADVRDYNMFMALCRGFHAGHMLGEWTCQDACLQITYLDRALQDAEKRRTVELFESFGPRVVTRRQHEEIAAAQREKKLAFEYGLGYVIEERFYAIAPEAEKEIDEAGVDIESVADFVAAVPEAYADLCKQASDQIHRLHASGRLPAIYHEEDTKEVEPLLSRWKEEALSSQEAMKLLDMLYVTGRQLYECDELPEWKGFIDQYQRHWFDDDERFRHAYAVLENCPEVWLDKNGHYKAPMRPTEWITRSTELFLGLVNHDNKTTKSVERVGAALRDRLDTAEQNIRLFLAIKAVLDAAADAVGLDVPGNEGVLAGPNTRLGAHIALYNLRLEDLKEEQKSWESGATRLEKALKMLPAIEVDGLKPSPDSLKQLKDKTLDDARGEEWLRTKVRSVECVDGINFKQLLN
ncbi:MAG: hypothetical protein A2Y76_04685 [Planctomycetes bacterium RBG_13_60_9]|nr:MAG: hypothetical protein A2Y76_04685 [Planctomycetes bacterium RBG_13_60_9]